MDNVANGRFVSYSAPFQNVFAAVQAKIHAGVRHLFLDRAKEKVTHEKSTVRGLQMNKKPKWNRDADKKSKSKGKGSDYNYAPPTETAPLDCFFVFKYDDVVAFQVENGDIIDYQQVLNDDDGFITICQGHNCAGEPNEVVGVASGRCNLVENIFEFTIATDEDPQFLDFEVYCPDITWVGGGECDAIDISTEAPLEFNPILNVIGPEVTITEIEFQSLVRCRIICKPRL